MRVRRGLRRPDLMPRAARPAAPPLSGGYSLPSAGVKGVAFHVQVEEAAVGHLLQTCSFRQAAQSQVRNKAVSTSSDFRLTDNSELLR